MSAFGSKAGIGLIGFNVVLTQSGHDTSLSLQLCNDKVPLALNARQKKWILVPTLGFWPAKEKIARRMK